jgi:hypothetical protein
MRPSWTLPAAAAAMALLVAGNPALAASNRAWVSGHGVDQAGCGAPTAPCRSLQYAHDHVAASGGEIDILDPAGYGAVTITKSISIVNDGVGTAGLQASTGNAITINAGPGDSVYLRGLNLDGLLLSATNGVLFSTGGSLTVVDCVARHFSGSGIFIEPTSGDVHVLIADTITADNGGDGIASEPIGASGTVTGVIERVISTNNDGGIGIFGGEAGVANTFTVSDSTASTNAAFGLVVEASQDTRSSVNVDSSHFDNNGFPNITTTAGLLATKNITVRISGSTFDANSTFGIVNTTDAPGGVFSTDDNHIDGNASGKVSGHSLGVDGPS